MASVFSAIIAGKIPGDFVWKDDEVVAFMTIAPITTGHVLVVPRDEIDQWQDIDSAVFAKLTRVAQALGQAVRKAFDAPRAGLLIAGLEVPHLHLHVFPAYDLGDFNISNADSNATPESRKDAAEKVRAALTELGFAAEAEAAQSE
jgi:diadenosine tetraphosphate (Ap4A) HIT family hydrolase